MYSAPAWGGPTPSAEDVANGVEPNPNAIGGLGDGRTYGVIKTSTTALQLGIEFEADSVVDPNKAALSFSREHLLETGDRVIYTCSPGNEVGTRPAAGLLCNQTYYVYKIDEFKVRLSTSLLPAGGSNVFSFDPSGAAGSDVNVASTTGLANGQALVYRAPPAITFTSNMVDIQVDGGGNLVRSGGNVDHSSNNDKIYAFNHGALGTDFNNGIEVVYTAALVTDDPTPPDLVEIGGLDSGVHYWIHVDGSDPHRVQLADSECHAGVGTYDADPGAGVNIQPCSSNIQVLSLVPDFSPNAQKTTHTLRRADRPAIFTEGNMYIVDNVVANTSFRLLNPVTLAPVAPFSGGNSNGTHRLVNEGIAVISNGTGIQSLVVDLTSSGSGSPHVLAGIGGPESLLGEQDGVVSGTSTGIGGGLFDIRDATSFTASRPKVITSIGAAKLRGEDILISSASQANVAVASIGEGGGFASFGESNANADVTNIVHTTIDGGADLFATHNIAITSKGIDIANGKAVNATGGLIAGADTDSTLELGYDVKTTVAGTVAANRTLLIDSAAGFDAKIYARSSSGGLGTDADANDDSGQGIRIGQGFGALVESRIVDGATIAAKLIYGSSGVGVAKGVDFANGNVTSSALSAKADSKSSARAAALGADSDAGAYVRYSDSAKVVLEGNSLIEGDAVVLRASHENVDLNADAGASCSCGGGDTDATARVIFHLDSRVQADDSSVVRTANLLVEALAVRRVPLQRSPERRRCLTSATPTVTQRSTRSGRSCGTPTSTCSASRTRSSSWTRPARSSLRATT